MNSLATPFFPFFKHILDKLQPFYFRKNARMTSAVTARAADILQRCYRQTNTFTAKPRVHMWHEDSHPKRLLTWKRNIAGNYVDKREPVTNKKTEPVIWYDFFFFSPLQSKPKHRWTRCVFRVSGGGRSEQAEGGKSFRPEQLSDYSSPVPPRPPASSVLLTSQLKQRKPDYNLFIFQEERRILGAKKKTQPQPLHITVPTTLLK